MKFQPKTEKELQERNLIPEGYYNFEMVQVEEKLSQAGNPMISLKMKIIDANNRERFVFDRLMEAFSEKLRAFCYATGLAEKYEQGELSADDCKFKSGRLHLVVSPERNGNGTVYKARNEVKDYYSIENNVGTNPAVDEDVPF